MPTQSRTVRVFLSSTFRDFAEERDLLVRKVFPELRRKCRERQVELVDVDLRWGITEEEAQQGKVLPICLAEIDRSRPFFMGFIGERYGWIPEQEKYDLSFIMEQPWLDQHRGGKSVTELEMLHGVLNNPAMEDRAFFYFRDPKWSQKKGGAYLSEGSLEKEKLEALKDRIRKSGFPVVEDYPTPEALAEQVKKDLWNLIDEAFPESEVPDALAQERMRHEAFAASRLGLYIGGTKYFEALDAAMPYEPRRPVLVTGDSGGGKSALLANWSFRFSRNNPSAILLTHCLATGADAAQPVNMAVRILREISRITGEELVLEGDPRKALHMLTPWLTKAGAFAMEKGGLFVLLLDGLDKMDARHDMGWWPSMLPEGVGLVVSCLSGKVFDAISERMDWEKLPVSPLRREDCETFIAGHLGKYRKSLTPEFTSKVLAHPLSGNPLFLRTLLEELRVFGVHEELGRKLDHYLSSQTVDDLFERVLERIETDNSPESVRAVLEVIWGAKESFAEDELLTVSGLPPAVWAPIHIALDESLIGAGGRLAFSHDYLRKAVEDRYLPSAEDRCCIQKRMAQFCAQAIAGGRKDISHYVRRHAVEHFLEVEDWDNTTAALSDLEFIETRAIAQELPSMLTDYAKAVELFPEGEKERETEAERQSELDRYARKMHEYSATWTRIRKGSGEPEPTLPCAVESVRLWTEKEVAAERHRMTEAPDRLDTIKALRVFVATNSAPLQQYSTQKGFAANLARNDAPAGPVHEQGKRQLEPLKCIKLKKRFSPVETHNPLPACTAILEGHSDQIRSIVVTDDGRLMFSGGADNMVRFWNTDSGECVRSIKLSEGVLALALIGGDMLAAASGNEISIWSIQTGQLVNVLQGHSGMVVSLAATPKGDLVSMSLDGTLRIWDPDSCEILGTMRHGITLKSIRESYGDKPLLESGGQNPLYVLLLWGGVGLAATPDGKKIIYALLENNLNVLDAKSGENLTALEGHSGIITSISLSRDGKILISGSLDGTIRAWNLHNGKCLHTLSGHSGVVVSTSVTFNGRLLVSCGADKKTIVWDLESGKSLSSISHSNSLRSLAFAPDGKTYFCGTFDGAISVWNTQQCLQDNQRQKDHNDSVNDMSFSISSKTLFSAGADNNLFAYDLESGKAREKLVGHSGPINSLAISNDGRCVYSASHDKTIRAWNRKSGECLGIFEGHRHPVHCIKLSESGRLLFSGDGDLQTGCFSLRCWDTANGECKQHIEGQTGPIYQLAPDPAGETVYFISGTSISGEGVKKVQRWDISTNTIESCAEGHSDTISSLVVSPDGRNAFYSSIKGTILKYDLKSGALIGSFDSPPAYQILISPDARRLIFRNLFLLIFLDSSSMEIKSQFTFKGLSAIAVNWPNQLVACGFSDGRIEFYDIQNLPLGPFITTAHREIISEDLPAGVVTARPPCCWQLISIPETISERIEHWSLDDIEGGHSDPRTTP
jgi:nephrocystin-3